MSTQIKEALELARSQADPAPGSELDTIFRIIVPLLTAMGYQAVDYVSEGMNSANGRPDFTILPGSSNMWFLEAKSWNQRLSDAHAHQVLNYVNTASSRWAMLTNGREWRLYDNYVQAPLNQRLVAQRNLSDDAIVDLLQALSKEQVQSRAIEHFASNERLFSYLRESFQDDASSLVKAMVKTIKNTQGLEGTTGRSLVRALQVFMNGTSLSEPVGTRVEPATNSGENREDYSNSTAVRNTVTLTIAESVKQVTKKVPTALRLNGFAEIGISKWQDVLSQAFIVGNDSGSTKPRDIRTSHSKSLIAFREGTGIQVSFREPKTVSVSSGIWHYESNLSAVDCLRYAIQILEAFGVDTSKVTVTFTDRKD